MKPRIEKFDYVKNGEHRRMIVDADNRRLISDTESRVSASREAAWSKSDRIFKSESMSDLPGIAEFREAKQKEIEEFMAGSFSIVDILALADKLRMEAAELFTELTVTFEGNSERTPKRSKRSSEDKMLLASFFDLGTPCAFEGCAKLREEWAEAYEAAGGDDCPDCVMGPLRRQYENRVLELVNGKSG